MSYRSAPILMAPCLWFFVPDSVSWLVAESRLDEVSAFFNLVTDGKTK